ncbi:uncharacterized protein LOC117584130 [Drosophila guanche]|uniref:Uncharacterized protein n=1 Tax=Drosophila guanche TaxID=7266 RepID=A0A3B0JHZ7_DROGU|nr:uncharacterized protein LOC117584130 [Drosophila guanche]XP_034128775.1 uncharacterized protein LOC117584130 [Drosophila guanche]SPP81825.1 Hypothetical predicted protein [Drosophila guanche]
MSGRIVGVPQGLSSRSHNAQEPSLALCFQRKSIMIQLMKHMAYEGRQGQSFSFEGCEDLLDTFLRALATYMASALKGIIEYCEHRTGYDLHGDMRFVLSNDLKAKMELLDKRDREDHCLSDEEDNFKRQKPASDLGMGMARRLETTNNTALNAIGPRNREVPLAAAQSMLPAAKRWKYICVTDVIGFLNHDKRYAHTKMLSAANSKYDY